MVNALIFLYLLLIAPKLLFDRLKKGKKHPELLQRLGFKVPQVPNPAIWIHAVSVGEVKAAQPLFLALKKAHPNSFFLITTTSATGQAEAKRSLPTAHAFAYLPIDLSWVVKRWVKKVNPIQFILIESDFWPNLLKTLKKNGTKITLVSGKMSERSAKRFRFFLPFAKRLFAHFNALCVQNEDHYQRFFPLVPDPKRLHITGNLKLDIEAAPIQPISLPLPTITVSCTHPSEEESLLNVLLGGPWLILLAPRHPERFQEVAQMLTTKKIPFSRWNDPKKTGPLILVDAMGQLPICYASSKLAILGGSYVTHIGGHNILEPCLYGAPVLFGPYTFGQKELVKKVEEAQAGHTVPLSELRSFVEKFFANTTLEMKMKAGAIQVIKSGRGATLKTLPFLKALVDNYTE